MAADHASNGWSGDTTTSKSRSTAERGSRWPEGFVCPACSGRKGWKLEAKPWTWECAGCGRQTSATAGTIMHRTHLPLRTWFLAAHLVTTHSNGISALQLQAKLGIGSYKAAWLLLHKLRRAMVDPNRATRSKEWSRSTKAASPTGRRTTPSAAGKAGRIRLTAIKDYSAATLQRFVADNTVDGSTILTDGFSAYPGMRNRNRVPRVVGAMAAHSLLPWVNRVFANLKRLALGVYHGFRRKHVQAYLDEFVFRWNRRRHYRSALDTLLGIGIKTAPINYWTLIESPSPNISR